MAAADAELRALFDGLAARGVLEDALVVVTADHGEEFKEHGLFAHGLTLYEPAIRVPLLVVGDSFPAGHVAEPRVSLLDFAPTVLEHLGLPAEPRFEGHSLLPAVHGLAPERAMLIELISWEERDWRQHEAARRLDADRHGVADACHGVAARQGDQDGLVLDALRTDESQRRAGTQPEHAQVTEIVAGEADVGPRRERVGDEEAQHYAARSRRSVRHGSA